MSGSENERIAVLETNLSHVSKSLEEHKLASADASKGIMEAIKDLREKQTNYHIKLSVAVGFFMTLAFAIAAFGNLRDLLK